MGHLVQSPLGHKPSGHVQARLNAGLYQSLAWLVGECQLELGVQVCLVGGVGLLDHLREVANAATMAAMSSRLSWRRPVAVRISAWANTFLAWVSAIHGPITAGSRPASRLAR